MPAGREVAGSARAGIRNPPGEEPAGAGLGRWGLWGCDGGRRSGAAPRAGLMASRERLFGRGMATGVAQRAVLREGSHNDDFIPPRPRGMHRRTYERLIAEAERAEGLAGASIAASMSKRFGRRLS